jgi:alanyl-tRNA synthetase
LGYNADMPRTEKLYYSRPDLRIAEATVLAATGSPEAPTLELDATIFYPEGGGQGCDLGSVAPFGGSGEVAVSAVIEEGGRILHALAAPCPAKPGDRVLLRLDAERRLDYSQAHSGQHLLSSTFMRLLGAATVSVHLGRERCLVDLDIPAVSEDDLAQAEDLVEGIIADDYPIRVHSCPPEDLASFPLRKRPPVGEEVVRVVEIDGIDFTPCCGTHLSSTGKLRLLRVLGTEKYKGLTRLYFAAGGRAAADYRSVSRIARETARALGTSVSALPEAVAREAERRKALELAVGTLERERAAAEAAAAPEASAASGPEAAAPRLAVRRYEDRSADSLILSAKAFSAAGLAALLASLPDLTVQVLSPQPEARLGERLKPCLALAGGKGGGGGSSFRAVFPDLAGLEVFMRAAAEALTA